MRKFFGIVENKYCFEWSDIWTALMVLNVIFIIQFGLIASWFGLGVAVFGLIIDMIKFRKINNLVMRISSAVLNIYFLMVLYRG